GESASADVVSGAARPGDPASWIDHGVEAAYGELHELGWAHSVEAWDADGLAGGLYGVSTGGLLSAESMFHQRTDASKAALVGLVELLRAAGDADRRLLDVEWRARPRETLGAVEASRAEYRVALSRALDLPSAWR